MHAGQCPDDFQMAQLFGADIHQHVFAVRILAVQALNRILHGGRELAVGAAELLQKHVAEARIRLVDANRVHEFLDVVIHLNPPKNSPALAGMKFNSIAGCKFLFRYRTHAAVTRCALLLANDMRSDRREPSASVRGV